MMQEREDRIDTLCSIWTTVNFVMNFLKNVVKPLAPGLSFKSKCGGG